MSEKKSLIDEITFRHPVKMPLTEREVIAYADEFAALDAQLSEATLKHEGEKAAFKAISKSIGEDQERILNLIRVKEEMKQVECLKEYDYFEQIVIIKRADNGETVTTRKMSPDEMNRELPFSESLDSEDEQ
jgi:hypothetical protein